MNGIKLKCSECEIITSPINKIDELNKYYIVLKDLEIIDADGYGMTMKEVMVFDKNIYKLSISNTESVSEENDLLKVENENLRKQLKIAIEEYKELKGK